MAKPANPQALRALEASAEACERASDNLGALDIFEEIVANGWAETRHMTRLGYCYLENRQRQNAKESWLRAVSMDESYAPAREALDKFFPGWEKPAARSTHQPNLPQPPPAPTYAADAEEDTLTVQLIAPVRTPAPPTRPGAPVAPPAPARPTPARPRPVEPIASDETFECRVNWDFVMTDVAEEVAGRR